MLRDTAEVQFVIRAVRAASRLVRLVQQEMVSPAMTKDDKSPVTVGDFAAQAVVARLLDEAFPDDPLVGEESAAALREASGAETLEFVTGFVGRETPGVSGEVVCRLIDRGACDATGRFWTLDPIDGTKGFLRREQYAVALALVEDGMVQLGALGCPNLTVEGREQIGGPGAIFLAARGQGAWACPIDGPETSEFRQLRASATSDGRQARLLRSVEASHTHGDKIDEVAALLGTQVEPIRMDSQAKYAVLAAGGGDVILRLLSPSRPNYREKIWDQAAGSIVVEEAGGRATDLDGKSLDFRHGRELLENRGVFISNGHLHTPVLAALKQVGA